ncbi:FAD-dependent monooxygenase [Streptomyces sp. NBC_01390]|uniref:FAD-dependent monooxygenase n=1 Tax=Streptomyces sp. NBC_01390 TaxID=2903850 RepID=UPI0032514932
MNTSVVIVGGGPVGLMTACELGLAGVRTTVLEQAERRPEQSRAWGLHPRTVETLDRRGLLDGILHERALWPKLPLAGLWPLLDLQAMDSDHPYLVNVPQTRIEDMLEERARALGVTVLRGHEVHALAQDDDGVTVTASGPSGEVRLRAAYAVGCDGGRSVVRRLAGIDFAGTPATVASLLCDCTVVDMGTERRGMTRTERGTVNINLRPTGSARIVTTEFGAAHEDRDAPVGFDEFRAAVRRILGRDVDIAEPTWLARFGDSTRQADRYREGRVLLAGDAAHIHFPYGGLGLNLGLQDAVNLGWKLAGTVRGWAPDDLLDTYQRERFGVAQWVLDYSRAQLALLRPGRDVSALRSLLAGVLEGPEANKYLAELVTGTSIRYSLEADGTDAPEVVGTLLGDLTVKDGAGETTLTQALHPGKGVLLDLTPTANATRLAQPWAERVRTLSGAGAEASGAEVLLVRPDGYVAWAGSAAQAVGAGEASLRHALRRWFGG